MAMGRSAGCRALTESERRLLADDYVLGAISFRSPVSRDVFGNVRVL